MNFYQTAKSRKTIRDFSDQKVEKKIIEKILSTGLLAPTNDHLRNWEFVVITEKEIIDKILNPIPRTIPQEVVDNIINFWKVNAPIQKEMYQDAIPKQYQMLSKSQCLILLFFKQTEPLLHPKSLSGLNGFASIWCCIQNIMLATTAEKLGCAIKIPFEKETQHIFETLNHPKDYVMPCYLAIGHPLPQTKTPKQNKQNIKDKIHYNKW